MIVTITAGDQSPMVDVKMTWVEAQAFQKLITAGLTAPGCENFTDLEKLAGAKYLRTLEKIKIG